VKVGKAWGERGDRVVKLLPKHKVGERRGEVGELLVKGLTKYKVS
jgi:hypothetical protein